jgi:pilus assembly protein Flp/PilA
MIEFFHALRNREEGQALVEYGLILALVSVACVGTLALIGTGIDGIMQTILSNL